jgi:RES domain-containing protein
MTPLPAVLGGKPELVGWRLDRTRYGATWDAGEGARREGGRWNSAGRAVVYCSLDPATTILEKAVHAGFAVLDTVPHVLTRFVINAVSDIHIVTPANVPNANWLRPTYPSAGQQRFGDALLAAHPFVLIPSAVSSASWNLLFDPVRAAGAYSVQSQEPFALDTRLHRPVTKN